MSDITNVAFPLTPRDQIFSRTPVKVNFAKYWALATKTVIGELNDRLKVGTVKASAIVNHLRSYTHDILTVDSITTKMRSLLADLDLRYFPAFSLNTFWGFNGKFKFARVLPSKRARVLQIVNGRPLLTESNQIIDNEAKLRVSCIIY